MKSASILTIGDELLIGQVINTNASTLSQELNLLGIPVNLQMTVGDRPSEIQNALKHCLEKSDYVFISGGLGPTHDDLTVETVADFLHLPLIYNEEIFQKIKSMFEQRKIPMMESNRKQALVPQGAVVLDNSCGTAPGLFLQDKIFIMPGVPHELKEMFQKEIVSRLSPSAQNQFLKHRTIHTFGIGESLLAEKLSELPSFLDKQTTFAYLPNLGEVRLRISIEGPDKNKTQEKMLALESYVVKRLEKHIYGFDGITLEEAVAQKLLSKGWALATAESCTGGLLSHRLTNVSGSSQYLMGGVIAYSNEIKINTLNVPRRLIEEKGAVSEEVALAMATGVREKFKTDLGVALTGIAGPTGGTPTKPVGLVYIAVVGPKISFVKEHHFEKDRLRNKERSTTAALGHLFKTLDESRH